MFSMVQAGSMGLPFIAVRGLLGSDILRHRPDFLVINHPFQSGEEVVVAQPIRPEVAIFHALKADRWGNAMIPGRRDDLMMARASRWVIVTAEEILEQELTLQDAVQGTFLPALDVDAVIHVPLGAHPTSCGDLYPVDQRHLKLYLEAAGGENTFGAYLEKYVFSVKHHQEYLERAGVR